MLPSPLPWPHKYRGLVHILQWGMRALFPHAQNPHGGPHPFLKSYHHFGTAPVMEIDWTDGCLRFLLSMCELQTSRPFPFMEDCTQTACFDCSPCTLHKFFLDKSITHWHFLFYINTISFPPGLKTYLRLVSENMRFSPLRAP